MRSLIKTVAVVTLVIMCIGGVAGTAFAVLASGSVSGLVHKDDGVTPIAAAPFVANDGNTGVPASDAYTGSSTAPAVNAPVISGVTATNITATSATIIWETNDLGTSQVEYGTSDSYGSTATVFGLVISHSVDLTGLSSQTTYHYRVISADALDDPTQSGDYTFTTLDVTGPVISSVTATNITATSATITWTTDEAATSQVEYGIHPGYGSTTTLYPNPVTDHSVGLTGLSPQKTYHYRVKSTDASGNLAQSERYTFGTLDATAPVINGVMAIDLTATTATIIWTTNETATSQVEYGLTTGYGSTTPLDTTLVTSHRVDVTGLSPKTAYHYRVKSTDASGNLAQSADYAFTTADNDPPVISNVTATNITAMSVTFTWTTDDPAQSQVEYGTSVSYGSITTLDPNLVTDHRVSLTGLSPQTTYHYKVKSRDDSGLWAESGDYTFTTPDVTPPAIPGVVSTDITATSATIIWTTNEAATSLVVYGTSASYGSTTSQDIALVTSHSVNLTGLSPQTTYHYKVKSSDASGLWAESGDYTFITVDINAPVISSVTAINITGTSATITWTTDDPAESQVEYGTSAIYGSTTTLDTNRVTGHSMDLAGLSTQTTYYYKVKSRDASGLWAESADHTFTTDADPGGIPPVISSMTAADITGSVATITWTTDREATSQVEYGLTTDYGSTMTLDESLMTDHGVDLRGLKANSTYHYRVISRDAFQNQAQSEDQTFTTTIGKAPSFRLPTWAWIVIGVTVALVLGAMFVRDV